MTQPDPRPQTRPAPAGGAEFSNSLITPEHFDYAASGNVTTGTAKATFRNNTGENLKVTNVVLAVGTAPTGAALIANVKANGTAVFSAGGRPKIAVGAKSGSAAPDVAAVVAPGQSITVDVDQVGSTVAGADLAVTVEAVRVGNQIDWRKLRDGAVRTQIRQPELLPLDVNA